jgi:probable phosphoglycerate mutase
MGRLVLVRHGQTEWSHDGRHTSRTDIELTDEGRRAAELLRPRLAASEFVVVLTSPRQRARETAALAGFADRAVEDDDLAEWDYGDYEGQRTIDIRLDRPGWSIWNEGVPNGETIEQVAARADRVVERAREADGDILAFAHAHFLRVVAARWLWFPPQAGRHFGLSTTGVSVLGKQREDAVVELWNDTSHLHPGPRGDWDREAL